MVSDNLGAAKNMFFFALIADIVLSIWLVLDSYQTIAILDAIKAGLRGVDQPLLDKVENADTIINFSIATTLAVGGALLYWLTACYDYAENTLRAGGFEQKRWKSWGWVIPVAHLYKPYQVLRELYKVGAPSYADADGWKTSCPPSRGLLAWWIFHTMAQLYFWISFQRDMKVLGAKANPGFDAVYRLYEGRLASYLLAATVAVAWFFVAASITRRLQARSPLASQQTAAPQTTPSSPITRVDNSFGSVTDRPTPVPAPPAFTPSEAPSRRNVAPAPARGPAPAPPTGMRPADPPAAPSPPSLSSTANDRVTRAAFAQAMQEVQGRTYDQGMWAMALVEANGDERAAGVAYMRTRAMELIAEKRQAEAEVVAREAQERARSARERTAAEEQQRASMERRRPLEPGEEQAWGAFYAGGETGQWLLVNSFPLWLAHGSAPDTLNKRGENVLAYALRFGHGELAAAALGAGATIPTLVEGFMPLGQWGERQIPVVAQFIRDELLPRLYQWMQGNLKSRALTEMLWSMLHGVELQADDLLGVLGKAGMRVEETTDGYVLFRDANGRMPEILRTTREFNRAAAQLMLSWLEQRMRTGPVQPNTTAAASGSAPATAPPQAMPPTPPTTVGKIGSLDVDAALDAARRRIGTRLDRR